MAPLPVVPNALKVTLTWAVDNDVSAMNVLHFAYTGGPPTSAQCTSMATTIAAAHATHFASLIRASYATSATRVLDLSSDTGGEGEAGGFTDGTRSGTELAPGTSLVISKHVARHYRGGHPRSYLPVGASGDVTNGRWDPTFADSVHTAYGALVTDILGAGVGCTITNEISVSYVSAGAPRVTPVKDVILSTTADSLIGSQRRRNRKQ